MKKSIWITLLLSIVLSLTSLSAQVQRANLALGKPVTTNDTGPQHDPSKLVDGNSSTRWGSQMESDGPFHVIIDLEAPFLLDSIFLHWEAAFASSYTLHVSTDEEYWEKVATVENQSANNLERGFSFDPVSVRYVKLNCKVRSTQYGYSAWELEVFGQAPEDWVAAISVTADTEFPVSGKSIALEGVLLNSDGDPIPDKSDSIVWNIVDENSSFGDNLTAEFGGSTLFRSDEPYREIKVAASYTDSEYSNFTFVDTLILYINPDPEGYDGAVRCDLVSRNDTCVELSDLVTQDITLPENITRIAENGSNICLPPEATFDSPVDIVFVIDHSGSMGGNDPNKLTPVSISRALDTLYEKSPDSRVGHLGFGAFVCEGPTEKFPWDDTDTRMYPHSLKEPGHYDALQKIAQYTNECAGGETYYTPALKLASEWLGEIESKSDNNQIILFFTDGVADDTEAFASYVHGKDSTNYPTVYTIALMEYTNEHLVQLTENTGGTLITISSAEQIDVAMQLILKNALTSLSPDLVWLKNKSTSETLETNTVSLIDERLKMYSVPGPLMALIEGENEIRFSALSNNDSIIEFGQSYVMDIKDAPLTKLGRQHLNTPLFDAVCYEPAEIIISSGSGKHIETINEEITNIEIALKTRSSGFEPEITMSGSGGDSETFELSGAESPYRSDAVDVSLSKKDENNGVIEFEDEGWLTFFWNNPLDPRDTAFVRIGTGELPEPDTTNLNVVIIDTTVIETTITKSISALEMVMNDEKGVVGIHETAEITITAGDFESHTLTVEVTLEFPEGEDLEMILELSDEDGVYVGAGDIYEELQEYAGERITLEASFEDSYGDVITTELEIDVYKKVPLDMSDAGFQLGVVRSMIDYKENIDIVTQRINEVTSAGVREEDSPFMLYIAAEDQEILEYSAVKKEFQSSSVKNEKDFVGPTFNLEIEPPEITGDLRPEDEEIVGNPKWNIAVVFDVHFYNTQGQFIRRLEQTVELLNDTISDEDAMELYFEWLPEMVDSRPVLTSASGRRLQTGVIIAVINSNVLFTLQEDYGDIEAGTVQEKGGSMFQKFGYVHR